MKQATYAHAGDELRINRGREQVATFSGEDDLIGISRAALAACAEGRRSAQIEALRQLAAHDAGQR